MYTAYKSYLDKRDNNKAQNYANTTGQNVNQRDDHETRKKQTEQRIQQLEQEEMQMLNSMQQTLARKEKAIETLKGKSAALQKNIEPRNAYLKHGQSSNQKLE